METYRRREGKWMAMTNNAATWKTLLKKNFSLVKEQLFLKFFFFLQN